jgi:flagellar biosynthesis/type III secretory pathway protein FliH
MTEGYQQWRDDVYSPRMRELHGLKNEITARHQEALRRELEHVEQQIADLAAENTERLGGPTP